MSVPDEEEVRARQAMRRHLRGAGTVLAWMGLLVGLMLGSLQAAMAWGARPAVLGVPLALYAACLYRFARQRSPGLAAFCLLCAWAAASLALRVGREREDRRVAVGVGRPPLARAQLRVVRGGRR